ncbi:HlyD family efflux transporter periplasmic adaptor subunit [Candidatus Thiothrix sp. Deng01]|uniref:HlyD family efflux transporter periplasmic adaptor subunit n=1 Tax=Candidatus Thiothrix phosphatis TaxID=3112415 RepID=A0ABU6CT39_9GAMM|nr:HlyD family efflux transporter periplasmic adaptor subunit [Candidatus Thiothrix sp. Deng01]MEB4589761.1 HlyD family efflux transporter periplasmic adaptor subunit [Candidatus Thiothrix sp. Deng01]
MKVTLALLFACLPLLSSCEESRDGGLQGYVEGEYVRLAAPFAGTLQTLAVQRGAQVKQGAPAFTLEQQNETAARQGAEDRLHAAEAQLADLQSGKRPQELQVIRAQLAQAKASAQLAAAELQRVERLVKGRFVASDQIDTARANDRLAKAKVSELEAQVKVAELAARPDAVKAAEANVASARAALEQADWQLGQKSVVATRDGLVNDTYYQPGEWVAAGSPVISILPPENRKVRFFVPEPQLGELQTGQTVQGGCDGCGEPIPLHISYISPQAEYTPPVIYSKDSRAKLVYMVEAVPDAANAARLKVGQPVDIALEGLGKGGNPGGQPQ